MGNYVTTTDFQRFLKTFDGVLGEFEKIADRYNELNKKCNLLFNANEQLQKTVTSLTDRIKALESCTK